MWEKIVAFFMSIIAFIIGLFGVSIEPKNYEYENYAYGTQPRQVMDLYLPKDVEGEIPLVLLIHGGAWVSGDKSSYTDAAKNFCESYAVAGASINYRYLSDAVKMSDLLDDIEAALAEIKKIAAERDITINKVMLGGHSAGGHLSMLYAYSRAKTAPITPAVVLNYSGPTDCLDVNFYTGNGLGREYIEQLMSWAIGKTVRLENISEVEDDLKAISPLYYVNENTVPTVINHGMRDSIVPYSNAISLDEKLSVCNVPHAFNPYPNSDHDLGSDKASAVRAEELLIEFARAYLF